MAFGVRDQGKRGIRARAELGHDHHAAELHGPGQRRIDVGHPNLACDVAGGAIRGGADAHHDSRLIRVGHGVSAGAARVQLPAEQIAPILLQGLLILARDLKVGDAWLCHGRCSRMPD